MKLRTLLVLVVIAIGSTVAQAQCLTTGSAAPHGYGDSEFKLGPDDVIQISVYQEKDLDTTVPVRPDGKISIPLIGEMPASGKTAIELQKEIAQRYTRFIAEPAVTVIVKEINSPKVSVLGEVKSPGTYKIKDRATILDAIALAGGLTEYAKKDNIRLIRQDTAGERHTTKIKLDDQIKSDQAKGRRSGPCYVLPYDTIYVE
jgi:polysaccharide export outer membrane protein